jgi:hypothetical protein
MRPLDEVAKVISVSALMIHDDVVLNPGWLVNHIMSISLNSTANVRILMVHYYVLLTWNINLVIHSKSRTQQFQDANYRLRN